MSEPRRITDDYRLDKLLRSSPSGSVFRATRIATEEPVAVKLIVGEESHGAAEEQAGRFLAAAGTLQALRHPALPRVLDFGFTTAGSAFLVTELLHGSTLEAAAGSPAGRVLPLLLQVVGGLQAMEEQGLAHRNLRADHILVVAGPPGEPSSEEVKMLGLGGVALRSAAAAGPESRRADLHDFAVLACKMLGIAPPADSDLPRIDLPERLTPEIANPEALRTLLEILLQDTPAPPPLYGEVAQTLRFALAGDTEGRATLLSAPRPPARTTPPSSSLEDTVALPKEAPTPPTPPPPPPSPPPPLPPPPPAAPAARVAPAEVTEAYALPRRRPSWLLPLVAGAAAFLFLIALVAFLPGKKSTAPPPASPSPTASLPQTPRPEVTPEAPAESPLPVEPEETGTPRRETLAADLASALRAGDLKRLRAAVRAFSAADRKELTGGASRDLERASRILEVEARLTAAEKAGRPAEGLAAAVELIGLLPSSESPRAARQRNAEALESAADADFAAGRLEEALRTLEGLRQVWPERSGLAERVERIQTARRDQDRMEALLAAADREGKAGRPHEGLRLLSGAAPGGRFEERFRQARTGLEAQLARLDQAPPSVTLRGALPEYEKGKSIQIPLRIADDYGVVSTELWARPEGGQYQKLAVRQVSGSDYEAEIPPALHQNKPVDFYALVTDRSGHAGRLGSPSAPQKVKRKGWLQKILD